MFISHSRCCLTVFPVWGRLASTDSCGGWHPLQIFKHYKQYVSNKGWKKEREKSRGIEREEGMEEEGRRGWGRERVQKRRKKKGKGEGKRERKWGKGEREKDKMCG